ncbi:MAG: PAS domain S-box protein [Syntrophobacteraceae bacterium]
MDWIFAGGDILTEKESKERPATTCDQETRQTLEEFRAVFENSQVGIMFLKEYRLLYRSNQRLADILGYDSPEEMAGMSMRGIHLSEERFLEYGEKYYKPLTQGVQIQVEYQLRRKDGSPVWCSLSGKAIDAATPPDLGKGVIWCVDDISRHKAAEAEITAQRETLAKIFESAPYIMMLVDREGRVSDINHRGATFSGRPQEALPGCLCGEIFGCLHSFHDWGCGKTPQCGHCPIRRHITHTFQTAQSLYDVEESMTLQRGEAQFTVVLLISTALVREKDGDKVLVTINDITDRKRSEDAVQESRERLSQILEFLPDPTLAIDPEGNVIIWNKAYENLTSIKAEDILGKGDHEYSLPFYGYRRPILIDAAIGQNEEILEKYGSVQKEGDILLAETCVSVQNREVVLSCKARPLYDSAGRIIGAIETVRDVTAIRKTQEMLRESEKRYRSIVENIQDVFYRTDRDGHVTMASPSVYKITGVNCEEIIGMDIQNFWIHPFEREEMLQKIRQDGVVRDYEVLVRKIDGTPVPVSITSSFLKDGQGNILGVEGVIRDITERKCAEEASSLAARELRLSEKRLRRAEVTAGIGNWEFILGSGTVYASEGARLIYGLEDREWTISEIKTFPLPQYRDMLDTALRELVENGKPYNVEHKIRRKSDGRIIDIHAMAEYSAEQGVVFGVVEDITERKRFEEALRESEQKYRLLADNVHDVIFTMDLSMAITYISPSAEKMYGRKPGEFQSLAPARYLTPAALDLAAKTLAGELALEGQPGIDPDRVLVLELEQYRKEGSTFWTEVSVRFLRNKEGTACGIIGTTRDITQRKQSDARAALLATAVEQADENILITDQRRTILYINPAFARSSGYSDEQLRGKKLVVLRSARHDAGFYTKMKETLDSGRVWIGTIFNRGREGNDFEIEGAVSPIRDASGAITHYLAVGRNMSRFRNLERELYQAQKMESVGRLAGGVAHDFNNMLSVMVGQTELALLEIDPAEPVCRRLQEILKIANRSADLVRQLLTFARKQTISPRVLDINEIVESMLNMLRRLIGEDMELLWKPGADIRPVKMDPTQLDQILANLCVNARDAIAGVGKITISTGNVEFDSSDCRDHEGVVAGRYVRLAVSDTGSGMDAETLQHIFEPFFTTKEFGKGTGLGLATVYGILEQNDGFATVSSEPGHGTTFNIHLPIAEQPAPPGPSEPEKELKGKETVLLVEDEEPLLELGKTILELYGYAVLAAGSPAAALKLAHDYPQPIHLVLTDVVMPEMNGKDLRDRLAAIKPGFKTIFMSGYTADVIAHQGVLDEGINFLEKPFSVKSLLQKVREVLGS